MYPVALNNSLHSSLAGTGFPTRTKGVQHFFPQDYLKYYCTTDLFMPIKHFFAICSFSCISGLSMHCVFIRTLDFFFS